MPARSPEEIRQSVVAAREDLAGSVEELSRKVSDLTDVQRRRTEAVESGRNLLRENLPTALGGAAGLGFLLNGGLGGLIGLFRDTDDE